jgi:excinuclease UvrABC nuclease subunit
MKFNLPKYVTKESLTISGLYFVMHKGKVVYIGQSVNVISRIFRQHDIITFKKHDKIRVIQCPPDRLLYYEVRWLKRFKPKYNTRHVYKWVGPIMHGGKRKRVLI